MEHVYWFIKDRLAGREGPAWAPWTLPELEAGGIRSIVSLATDDCDGAAIVAHGFRHLVAPIPDTTPADDWVERCCLETVPRACDFIESELDANRPVLVHCVAGRDRTGLLLAYYATRHHGLDAESAIARVRDVQPLALSAPGWEAMATRVITSLQGQSPGGGPVA